MQRDSDSLFNGRVGGIRAVERQGRSGEERGLCEKARITPAMRLRGVYEKGMA